MRIKVSAVFATLLFCSFACAAFAQNVTVGAERMDAYLPLLKGKRVALLVNQTSRVGGALLPDTLLRRGVKVVKLFVPEHGFRGTADAGAHVASGRDEKTGLPIISLYGANKKPQAEQLKDVDILVYDLQDVGARFYTYISTLEYAMQACAEATVPIPVVLLDRPNPNRHQIGGPVLDTGLRSFVGMQPVPILYGMTAGEYAKMLVGERWFTGADQTRLTVISCGRYDGRTPYILPVPPSPNLRTAPAILNYGWMCLFEGTVVSVGRGTGRPFEQWGHPEFSGQAQDTFRPVSSPGAAKPLLEGKICYGERLTSGNAVAVQSEAPQRGIVVDPGALIRAYHWYGKKKSFFNPFFEKLAGTRTLRYQIEAGKNAEQIAASWQPGLQRFKAIRKKYLLYPDVE